MPIVLVHGAGGSHLYWPPVIRRLSGFRVYSIDLPGHGKSKGHGFQSIKAYAGSIINWMGEVGLYRAFFVGHSMGGAIALTLANQYLEHVLGVGLIGTGARLRVSPSLIENLTNQKTVPLAISFVIANSFHQGTNLRLIELAQKRLTETRPSVLRADFVACNGFDMIDELSEINLPTLVICGEDDKMTPLRYSQFLRDSLPNAELRVVSNAGHMVMLEKPLEVGKALDEFLPRIPYSPGQTFIS